MTETIHRFRRLAAGGALAVVLASPAALLHLHLTKSFPAADATVSARPAAVQLWFSETPELALSAITLLSADSTRIALGKVVPADEPQSIMAAVPDSLAPGDYTVAWRAASKDGHLVRGEFHFTYRPTAQPTASE